MQSQVLFFFHVFSILHKNYNFKTLIDKNKKKKLSILYLLPPPLKQIFHFWNAKSSFFHVKISPVSIYIYFFSTTKCVCPNRTRTKNERFRSKTILKRRNTVRFLNYLRFNMVFERNRTKSNEKRTKNERKSNENERKTNENRTKNIKTFVFRSFFVRFFFVYL